MSKATLLELADRVEKASGPDGNLEAEIWLAVTPDATRHKWSYTHKATGRVCDVDETRDKFGHLISVPSYMRSIDAVRTLDGLCVFASDIGADGLACVKLVVDTSTTPVIEHTGIAPRLEHAWLAAALRARAQQESDDASN